MARFHHLDPIVHRGERPLPPRTESRGGRRPVAARPQALRRLIAGALGRATGGRRFYVGRLERSQPVVFVVDAAVRRLEHPGPLGWGSACAASRQLADGLLRDATGRRPRPHHVPRFVEEVVSRLPADGFVLGADYVQHWARVT